MTKKAWRTVWISDVHPGTRGCKAERLHAFLKSHRCDHLYLVRDIIDGWRIATAKGTGHRPIIRSSGRYYANPGRMTPGSLTFRATTMSFCVITLPEHNFAMGNFTVADQAFDAHLNRDVA